MSLRSGNQRAALQPPSSTNPRGIAAPNGQRNTQKETSAVISLDELDRIRSQITKTKEDSYHHQRDAYRKTLQETSKNRVQNWPNTMEAQRLKREEDRIKRLEDEEVSHQFKSIAVHLTPPERLKL